jgi:murein DD-endopeptidase MepM/ murein hydrolase activator NlpD
VNRIVGTKKRGAILLLPLLLAALLGGCARREGPRPSASAPASGGTIAPLPAVTRAAPTITSAEAAGIADVGTLPEPTPPPQVYVVQPGDTLSGIARQFGCDLEALVQANNLLDPNSLQIGQVLQVPSTQVETGPAAVLLPNSEFVYGPAYVDFDTATFAADQGGYLALYRETLGGETLSGPEIVDLVAHHYSVGPRLLLTILEMRGGWVTDPDPWGAALSYPMGYRGGGWDLLSRQLAWAADELNRGYYDWRGRGVEVITWGDGTASRYATTLNAATAGLQYFFSLDATWAEWAVQVGQGPGSFVDTYRRLFGDPGQYAVEPLIPNDTVCPEMALPWSEGELWYYTGGPHGGWSEGSAWSALDFVPDEGYLGCQAAAAWATAAAPGLVIYSRDGEVLLDLDGDGYEQTGWVLFYLHVATQGRVAEGTQVQTGDPIGHPSCEGGFSESTHLHLARRFNGEWIAADGPLPMVLSGWRFASDGAEYEGSASRDGEERTACECRDADFNGLLADR